MVTDQLRRRGIADERVLSTMEKVPRHLFIPPSQRSAAYEDCPLPIGMGQTISQPYMVARMTELLRLNEESRVLEIGTGSGYQTAVLAELAAEVWTVERLLGLASRADTLLQELGYTNVRVITGDGTLGYADEAPYDSIIVTAAAPHVPTELQNQLAPGGRMVIPVTAGFSQDLLLVECVAEQPPERPRYRETSVLQCTFVPLIGKDGYRE
jgi:protein-L-isoaspartate(D-aspartate) O-methyltransferase